MTKDIMLDFFPEIANVKDEHLHIMRGHLLIEKKLRELIDTKVAKPEALSDARLSFNQILCIAEALYWEEESNWLWQQIRKLNNIRNGFSHQLEPKKYDKDIKDFIEMCVEDPHELSAKSSLVVAMYSIYKNLNELRK
jgi:hypothetical protein